MLKIFLLLYFENHQILLNILPLEHHHKIERKKNSSVMGYCMLSYLLPMNYAHLFKRKKLLLGIYSCAGFSKHPISFWELQPCFYICIKVEEPLKLNLEEHESLLMPAWHGVHIILQLVTSIVKPSRIFFYVALFLLSFKRVSKAKFPRKLVNIWMVISIPISWILT